MPSSRLECKPCSGMLALFKSRRPRALELQQPALLHRAFGRMKNRRRRARSFSSVRAVFWPLMSMRSDTDRNDVVDRPPSRSSPDSGADARAPSPSLNPPAASSTTVARVLALQAQLGEAAALASPTKPSGASGGRSNAGESDDGGVEEACRSFENHLMEMLVEERKVRDLMDVEELLCCWEKLRCPVFVQLVGRFYGELCMDLFSGRDADVSSESSGDLTI